MFLSPRWPAAAAISDFYDGLKKSTIKDFLMVANWTPSPQNLFVIHPLDLIVLHKPVETSNAPEPRKIMATEVYDESDMVLSNLLGDDQQFNNQIVPEVPPWDNFWDIGGAEFEPRVMNWLQMTAPGPPIEQVPMPAPVQNFIEMPMSQDAPAVASSPPPAIEINFEALKKTAHLLPACNRCRTRRIKCERVSLECQQCKNAASSCVYFDQLLSKNIACRSVYSHTHPCILTSSFNAELRFNGCLDMSMHFRKGLWGSWKAKTKSHYLPICFRPRLLLSCFPNLKAAWVCTPDQYR
jgi:hypothetical protein